MANRFQIKRTYVTGRLPNTTDPSNTQYIAAGEFAMNMVDKQLYTSNGSTLITIGTTGTSLQLSDSIRIGDISTQLLTINSTSIFAGNTSVTTYVNTTSISVANSSSNISINPTTLFVGNDTANVSLSMAGGVNAISISSANINSNAVVTIRTSVNHGITTLTQSKLLVSANNVSLNSENYSADYAQFGFDIRAVPTPNTISFVLPNDSFKTTSPGDRTIKSIERFSNGVVQVETQGPHLYSNGDLVYASGVGYVFADFYITGGSVANIINPTTLSYTQNAYATTFRSLIGATAFIYTPILEPNKSNDYLFGLQAADPVFNGFYPGDTITYVGLTETIINGFNNNAYSPSYFNGNHDIYLNGGVQINQAGTKTVLVKAGEIRDFEIGRYLYPITNPYIITQGAVVLSFEEVGKVNNNSQLCPVLQTSVIDGYIISTIPTGISLKNGSKLVYVLDNIIFVGNTTIGNIVDSKGSRAFRPDTVTIEAPTFSIIPNKYYVSEGDSVTFNITTTNFGSGSLYWTNIGTTIGSDFDNGLNSGSISIENDSGTFTLNLANDLLLEGPQSIQIELRTGSTSGPIVSTTFIISVNDTSFPPTYKITPDKVIMNEGQTVTYQIETTGVASGTTLYWTNDGEGVTTTGPDFTDGYNSGNTIINAGVGTFSRTLLNDLFVDQSGINTETIKIRLRTGSTSGNNVANAASVTVFDTSVPYYNVVASPTSLNEGGAVLFTVTAFGIAQGTTLYWSNEGTTTVADFNENINSGPLTIGSSNTASVALTLKNDLLLEGTETIVFKLRTGSVNGPFINAVSPYNTSATVTVNDTSVPTYSVAANTTSLNEGSSVLFTITTAGVANGTTLYWTNEGSTTDEDFTDGFNSGSFIVNNNLGYVTLTLKNDLLIEGTETIKLRVRTGSVSGTVTSGLSPVVSVLDTSTPSTLFRVSSIVPSVSSVNEGQSITFTINFQPNTVPNGSYLYWYNSGTTSGRDFSDGINSDIFIVNNDTATITRTLLNDYLTEGTETIVFEVHADSFSGPLLGSSTVTVNDSSLGTYSIGVSGNYFYNETDNNTVTFTINTTNIASGTKLYWDIPNNGTTSTVTAADFTDNIAADSIIINQYGTASITKTLLADRLTEGVEYIQFRLLNNPGDTTALASTTSLFVSDTSKFIDYQFTNSTYAPDLAGTGALGPYIVGNTSTTSGALFRIIGPINGSVNIIFKSWASQFDVINQSVPTYNKDGYLTIKTVTVSLNFAGQAIYNSFVNNQTNRGSSANTYISADLMTTDGKFKARYPSLITYKNSP